jgi:DNA-binding CsgD family transcriptional regulator
VDFLTFVDLTNRCASREELEQIFKDALSRYGVDGFIYSLVRRSCRPGTAIIHGVSHCYPRDWMQHYAANNYVRNDPTYRQIIKSKVPFRWKTLPQLVPYSKRDHQVMNEAEEAGLKRGISASVHGPYGEVMGFGFISKDGNEELSRNDLSVLHAMANQFHAAYLGFDKAVQHREPPRLTDKQRDILQLSASGKSRPCIADILKISENTVDDHVRRIFVKLECNDIRFAIVKAIQMGLITV